MKKNMNRQTERPIGQYAGKMRMRDDFSEPLPDEFWLIEEEDYKDYRDAVEQIQNGFGMMI